VSIGEPQRARAVEAACAWKMNSAAARCVQRRVPRHVLLARAARRGECGHAWYEGFPKG